MRFSVLVLVSGMFLFGSNMARADALALDEDLLRDAASLLEQGSVGQDASSVLPLMDLLATQNRSGGSGGGSGVGGLGIGLQVGTPTAITFKFGAGGNANIVLGVGAFSPFNRFGRAYGLSLHGDYLFTIAQLVNNGTISLDAYIGPGLWITLFDDARDYGYLGPLRPYSNVAYLGLAVRVPVGLSMRFATAPIEIYLELDPALFVFPGLSGFIGASLGFRYFF
jgi:hypothetical protein